MTLPRLIAPSAHQAKAATLASVILVSTGLAATCTAIEAEKLASGAFLQNYASVNGWSIRRISADRAGRKVLYCEATWTREADLYVYVSWNPALKEFAFGIPTPIPSGRAQAKLRVWFDGDKARAAVRDARYVKTPVSGDGEDGYLVATETASKPAAAELFAKAAKVTFSYPFDGKSRVEDFPYKTAAKAMARLADCASGR